MGIVTMENDPKAKPKELCTITILFPVESDEDALAVKRKIGDVMSVIEDARVDFRIVNMGRRVNGPPL